MSNFKPIDGSKEDFRKYLERKGLLDAITKVLMKCNSDRPENALQYLLENLGDKLKDQDTIVRLQSELDDARTEIEQLKKQLNVGKQDEQEPADGVSVPAVESTREPVVVVEVVNEDVAPQPDVAPATTSGGGGDPPHKGEEVAPVATVTAPVASSTSPAETVSKPDDEESPPNNSSSSSSNSGEQSTKAQ